MRLHKKVVLAIACGCVLVGPLNAMDRYFSTAGDDVKGAGTLISPFQTPEKALSVLMPGDRLIGRSGTYALGSTTRLISIIPLVAYQGESIVFQLPTGQYVPLNTNVAIWSDPPPFKPRTIRLYVSGGLVSTGTEPTLTYTINIPKSKRATTSSVRVEVLP